MNSVSHSSELLKQRWYWETLNLSLILQEFGRPLRLWLVSEAREDLWRSEPFNLWSLTLKRLQELYDITVLGLEIKHFCQRKQMTFSLTTTIWLQTEKNSHKITKKKCARYNIQFSREYKYCIVQNVLIKVSWSKPYNWIFLIC